MKSPSDRSVLISPYGGGLVDLIASPEEREELVRRATGLPSIQLTPRSLCDLELLATGAFSPLDRFMGKADYEHVVEEMRLASGVLFPVPITLSVPEGTPPDTEVVLRNAKNELIAILRVEEIFERDSAKEAALVCGTTDTRHPLVAEMSSWGRNCASGPLRVIGLPRHYDFPRLRRTPAAVRGLLARMGRSDVIAFEAQHAIDRADEDFVRRAAEDAGAGLLLQVMAGMANVGDIGYFARVRACLALFENYFDHSRTLLNLLPLATRQAGAREALWNAIVHRNYGASRIIVGPEQARETLARFSDELGVGVVPRDDAVCPPDGTVRPEVAGVLEQACPVRRHQGFCVWFTGLPSSGKSTIAEVLAVMLMEHGRQVTILDGDVVRTHLSKGLGFSKEDRDTNILRIGYVAAEITRHHGAVICAAVSPYESVREQVRRLVGADRFVLVYVATPIAVCEQRDVKKMYARARAGELKGFTGVDDPYEPPAAPDITLLTTDCTAEEAAATILRRLTGNGFLSAANQATATQ